jgi:hypothetical protein
MNVDIRFVMLDFESAEAGRSFAGESWQGPCRYMKHRFSEAILVLNVVTRTVS